SSIGVNSHTCCRKTTARDPIHEARSDSQRVIMEAEPLKTQSPAFDAKDARDRKFARLESSAEVSDKVACEGCGNSSSSIALVSRTKPACPCESAECCLEIGRTGASSHRG